MPHACFALHNCHPPQLQQIIACEQCQAISDSEEEAGGISYCKPVAHDMIDLLDWNKHSTFWCCPLVELLHSLYVLRLQPHRFCNKDNMLEVACSALPGCKQTTENSLSETSGGCWLHSVANQNAIRCLLCHAEFQASRKDFIDWQLTMEIQPFHTTAWPWFGEQRLFFCKKESWDKIWNGVLGALSFVKLFKHIASLCCGVFSKKTSFPFVSSIYQQIPIFLDAFPR